MSVKPYFILLIACSVLFGTACQKEIYDLDIIPPQPDSVTLVGSVHTVNYDRNDIFLWQSDETFDYSQPDRVVVAVRDSSASGTMVYTETFHYDQRRRLIAYENAAANAYLQQAAFSYTSSGDLARASLLLVNDQQVENTFTTTVINNQKVVTMYDTTAINGAYPAYRPQIVRLFFDPGDRLVRQLEAETGPDKRRNYWFRDTFDYRFSYDPEGDIDLFSREYSYVANGVNTPYLKDSVVFSRKDGALSVLYETFKKIYSNLYWFALPEYTNGSFARAMVHNGFYPHYLYYMKDPVEKIDYWANINFNQYATRVTGTFQNTYDTNGLLIRSVYPRLFANADGGIQEISYTYVKRPK